MNDSNAVRFTVTSQPLPVSWLDQDVGSVGLAGSASYANGTFTVAGAGQGTFFTSSDGFHFVYQPLSGDGTMVARVVSLQGSSAAQAGIMIRETLSAGASHVYLFDYSSSTLDDASAPAREPAVRTNRWEADAAVLDQTGEKRERVHHVRFRRWRELDAAGVEPDGEHGAERVRWPGSEQPEHLFAGHRQLR